MLVFSTCLGPSLVIVLSLTVTAGVSHWKLQDGVIKAIAGRTIITDRSEDAGSSGEDHVIFDKELHLLTTSHFKRSESIE